MPETADPQLLVFLALIAFVLFVNAIIALVAARALRTASASAARGLKTAQDSLDVREWLQKLAAASQTAAEWTTTAKADLAACEPSIGRAEEALERGIARADAACDRFCTVASAGVDLGAAILSAPSRFMMKIVSGLDTLRAFFRGSAEE